MQVPSWYSHVRRSSGLLGSQLAPGSSFCWGPELQGPTQGQQDAQRTTRGIFLGHGLQKLVLVGVVGHGL